LLNNNFLQNLSLFREISTPKLAKKTSETSVFANRQSLTNDLQGLNVDQKEINSEREKTYPNLNYQE